MRHKKNKTFPVVLLLSLAAATGVTKFLVEHRISFAPSPAIVLDPVEAQYEAQSYKKYHLGFQNLISGLLWVQLLQKSSHTPIGKEKVSWEYSRLDAITQLDPNFDRAYSFGAVFLSIFRRDVLGGKLLLEKWARYRPTYWRAHYMLGFHLFNEMGNSGEGSKEILAAAVLPGAPDYLSALGIRLLSQTGALAQAMKISLELYSELPEGEGRRRVTYRIRSLNYSLQEEAWFKALALYREQYHREPTSIHDLAPLHLSEIRDVASWVEVPEELTEMLKERFEFRYDPVGKNVVSVNSIENLGVHRLGTYVPAQAPGKELANDKSN